MAPTPRTVEEAFSLVLSGAPAPRAAWVPLEAARGCVLAEDCAGDLDMPPFDKAVMDGYAVRSCDTGPLRVLEEVPAGRVPTRVLETATCAKVMTGAPVPRGADAVQQVEKTLRQGEYVRLLEPVLPGQNIVPQGQDLKAGQVVLRRGHLVRAPEIGMLAAIGRTEVQVWAKPRCAVVVTGDELVAPDRRPGPGQIRNSNTFSIMAQVRAMGLECDDLGIVADEPEALRERLREGLRRDLLLVSGGVSAGDWDLVIPALEAEGVHIHMHQVLIKPGRPFCFAPGVFGLPGNPVSAFVIFEVFVRPYLGRMMGADTARPRVWARLQTPGIPRAERVQYLPARIRYEDDGYAAEAVPWGGSADLFALARANGFIVVPLQTAPLKGARVECMLLEG